MRQRVDIRPDSWKKGMAVVRRELKQKAGPKSEPKNGIDRKPHGLYSTLRPAVYHLITASVLVASLRKNSVPYLVGEGELPCNILVV